MIEWQQVRGEFEWDGSLRDLYVLDADIDVWQKLIDRLRVSDYPLHYDVDGQVCPLPDDLRDVFTTRAEVSPLLSVDVGGAIFNCHFFDEEEIEFDLDPREIDSEVRLQGLVRFMRFVAEATGRPVIMTPENWRQTVIFELLPGSGEISYSPRGGLP